MLVKLIRIEGLGNSSYLLVSQEARVCAVIDPARDVDLYLREAQELGVKIAYTLETHVHNDFVSGSRELAARAGATVAASAAGGLQFDHRPLRDGDRLELGELCVDVKATPGHTPEHVAFAVTDRNQSGGPHAVFTGGALLVGGIARTDLLGKQLAPFLGRWFFRTIRQTLQPLPDEAAVYPTHGSGSFCLAAPATGGALTSTVGQERTWNPFFQAKTEAEFLELALADLPSYPAYYKRMAGINRRGPRVLGQLPVLNPLAPREAWAWVQGEALAVDAREATAFAQAHIPGAYSIPLGSSFGTWVGWLIPQGKPLIFVTESAQVQEGLVRQLIRIGYDDLLGYLGGGMESWGKALLPTSSLKTLTVSELHRQWQSGQPPLLVDVRYDAEWKEGHVPTALHVELGDLPEHVDGLPRDAPLGTLCAAGVRACTAASILQREGFSDVALVLGGTNAWREAGYPLEKPVPGASIHQ
jgi:hydroxyacylglutathione hydrolase